MIKKHFIKNENGSVSILGAALIFAIIGISAFVIDLGYVYMEKQKFQAALDSTSVAAAWDLPDTAKAIDTMNKYIVFNGFATSDIEGYSFSDSNMRINLNGSKQMNYMLAKVLGFSNKTTKPVSSAEKTNVWTDAFGYTVFAGQGEVTVNGGMHTVNGDVYGKTGIIFKGNNNTINGNAVCTTGTISVDNINGNKIQGHPTIQMPDLVSLIKEQGIQITSQSDFDAYIASNTVKGPIYFTGTLNIKTRIIGTGIIYATQGITYDSFNQTPADSISFYSGGDITFNGNHKDSKNNIYGILYAPNGEIKIDGTKGNVYGRIIGKTVTDNGAQYDVTSESSDFNGIFTLKTVKIVN